MNIVEFYAGSGTISREFKSRGHNTFQIDIRKRKGICEPDLRIDIMDLERKDIPFEKIDLVWCSFPCQVFSYAAGDFHFKYGDPVSETAHYYIKLLKHTLNLISELNASVYFIENPRGQLRYIKLLLDWLVKNNGMTKELTYASYDFPSIKPTNLFTNAHSFTPRPLFGFGRGNKNPLDTFDAMTVCQKQKIPKELAIDIVNYAEKTIPAFSKSTAPFI